MLPKRPFARSTRKSALRQSKNITAVPTTGTAVFYCHSEGAKRPWESPGTTDPTCIQYKRSYREIATPACRLARNDSNILHFHINKYSARVNRAVFLSSAQSPAISKSKMMTIRSPVSRFFGSSRFKKSPAPVFCWQGARRGGLSGTGGGGGHSGGGGGHTGSGGGTVLGGGGGSGT